jgi:intein/homing endonuclease
MAPKILMMSDFPELATGQAVVIREISKGLFNTKKYDINVAGWGYNGMPHNLPYQVYPCSAKGFGKDGIPEANIPGLEQLIDLVKPDILWTVGDIWMVNYIAELKNRRNFKWIAYTPIDGSPVPEHWQPWLENPDQLVMEADYGVNEMKKYFPHIKTTRIHHGCKPDIYYPLPPEIKKQIKANIEYLTVKNKGIVQAKGLPEDSFIVGVVARNQPRKNYDKIIKTFKVFSQDKPNARLWIHATIIDQAYNLAALSDIYGVADKVCFTPNYSIQNGLSEKEMNKMMNIFDVHFLPTQGEGFCLLPDTLLHVKDNIKKIKDIKVGDEILSSDGKYHKIIKKFNREVHDYYKITPEGSLDILLTGEHPIYTTSGSIKEYFTKNKKELVWKKADELKKGDLVYVTKPKYDNVLPKSIKISDYVKNCDFDGDYVYKKYGFSPKREFSYSYICEKYNTTKKTAENAMKCLKLANDKRDLGLYGTINNFNNYLELSYKLEKDNNFTLPEQNKIKNEIKVDERLLEIFGWYLAEGDRKGGKGISFSLNLKDEVEVAERISKNIKDLFELDDNSVNIRKLSDRSVCTVDVSSVIISELFTTLFGKDAHSKKIPWILENGGNKLGSLISGLVHGDGSFNKENKKISFSTVSNDLALKLRDILLSNNIFLSVKLNVRKDKGNKEYNCMISRKDIDKFLEFIKDEKWNIKKTRYRNPIEEKDYYLVAIDKIEKVKKDTKVYDITVEDTHNFMADGILVHNCIPILETMSCGIPQVATDFTSHVEFAKFGGLMIPLTEYDDFLTGMHNVERAIPKVTESVKLLNQLYNDTELRKQLSIGARNKAETMSWESTIPQWENVIDDVLARKQKQVTESIKIIKL